MTWVDTKKSAGFSILRILNMILSSETPMNLYCFDRIFRHKFHRFIDHFSASQK